MRYVVGYTADHGGANAVRLAGRLATAALGQDDPVELDLVIVVRRTSAPMASQLGADPAGFEEIIDAKAREWAQQALALVPDAVTARAHLREAGSAAEGLIEAAQEFSSPLIIVAPDTRRLARTLGSEANALLHSSPVPVMLATPASAGADGGAGAPTPPTRLTVFVGTKEGAEAVALTAAITAQKHNLSLRIVSLVAMDRLPVTAGATAEGEIARVQEIIEDLAGRTTLSSTVVVGHGRDIEEAIASLEWHDDDLAMIGSSRLGGGHLFLGSTAYKVVREVPVPVTVIPRTPKENITLRAFPAHPAPATASPSADATGPDDTTRLDEENA